MSFSYLMPIQPTQVPSIRLESPGQCPSTQHALCLENGPPNLKDGEIKEYVNFERGRNGSPDCAEFGPHCLPGCLHQVLHQW